VPHIAHVTLRVAAVGDDDADFFRIEQHAFL
jgi:hypothetical protein